MKLRVKILQGEEFPIEVETDSMTVLELKKSLESRVNASAELISLVFLGRVLNDSRRLRDYRIDEDSRLFLAVKPTPSCPPVGQPPAEQRTEEPPEEPPAPGSAFITNLRNFLQHHFSAEDVDKIVSTMEAELKRSIELVNLDLVENIAAESLKIHAAHVASQAGDGGDARAQETGQ